MSLSLKVSVADMIEKIEAAKQVAQTDYEVDLMVYEAQLPKWHEAVENALAKAQSTPIPKLYVDNRYRKGHYGYVVEVPVKSSPPDKPAKPDHRRADRDLRLLRATSQDTVTVRADSDLARYL